MPAPRIADAITSPTSSILTPSVVDAYSRIAGDFHRCLPFALLEARRYFKKQAYLNPSDSDENEGRKLAVEALARKIVARTPMSEQYSLLSARFTVIEADGDESLPLSGQSACRARAGARAQTSADFYLAHKHSNPPSINTPPSSYRRASRNAASLPFGAGYSFRNSKMTAV